MQKHPFKKNVMDNLNDPFLPDELTERVQAGDRDAFARIYRTYFFDLCNFSYRYVKCKAVCEEIVQDLFLYIWKNRKEWNPDGTVRSYLYKSIKNRSLDHLKHKRVQENYASNFYEEREIRTSPQENMRLYKSEDRLKKAIHNAIESLPDQRKLIFKMSREDGLTYGEIADVMEISVKTVETQMGRSLKTLRKLLARYLPGLAVLTSNLQNLI